MRLRLVKKVAENLKIYKEDIDNKGVFWSIVHRLYKIKPIYKPLSFIINSLKPDYIKVKGFRFYIDKKDRVISETLLITGKFSESETEVFESLIKYGDVVVNIGAHVGYFTLLAADKVGSSGKVYSFEPDINNYRILKRNIEANNIINVTLVKCALSDKKGDGYLYKSYENTGDHKIYKTKEIRNYEKIRIDTIDNYFKNLNIKIDLIKIDVQGVEPKVIRGGLKTIKSTKNLKIISELWPSGLIESGEAAEEYLFLLEKLGFSIKEIIEPGKNKMIEFRRDGYKILNGEDTNILCVKK